MRDINEVKIKNIAYFEGNMESIYRNKLKFVSLEITF